MHRDTRRHPLWHVRHHRHRFFHHHGTAGSYVGRVGTLAVALGIGISAASGSCVSCAYADTGDSASSSGRTGTTSTSQSVNAGVRRTLRTTGTHMTPGSNQAAPKRAGANHNPPTQPVAAHAPTTRSVTPNETHVDLADVTPTPSATPSVPAVEAAAATPGAGTALATIREVVATRPQPVVIASPPIAGASLVTMVSKVLATLSDAVPGNTPSAPIDTTLALMVESVRRQRIPALETPVAAATRIATAKATASSATTTTTTVEGEKMSVSPSGTSRVVSDRTASSGYALALTGSGTASTTVNLPASSGLTIRARAGSGTPNMTLSIDGTPVTTIVVKSTSWADYTITGVIAAGAHTLSLGSTSATPLRGLYIDKVTTTTGSVGDEFVGKSGAAPSGIWNVVSGIGWDTGIQNYTVGNAFLDGQGHLAIRAVKARNGTYTSGRVESLNNMSFGYGTVTARIKVPKGQGLWPAFWLAGADGATVAWPQSGEIDVVELPSTTTTVYSSLHGPIAGSTDTQQAQIVSALPDLSTDYHNYWVRHLPNEITFGVDGTTLATLTPASLSPGSTWVYNRPMQVILNVAVGGPWAGAPDSSTQFPASMLVDWVRWDPPA